MALQKTLQNGLEYDSKTGQLIFNHRNGTALIAEDGRRFINSRDDNNKLSKPKLHKEK